MDIRPGDRITYVSRDQKFCRNCETHFEVQEDTFNDYGDEDDEVKGR